MNEIRVGDAVVYFHTSECMDELGEASVRLMTGVPTQSGDKWKTLPQFFDLLEQVYRVNGLRVLRDDGYALIPLVGAYADGEYIPRPEMFMAMCRDWGYRLLDVKYWRFRAFDFFLPPVATFYLFGHPKGKTRRPCHHGHDQEYREAVWEFPPTTGNKKSVNGLSEQMCKMLLRVLTEPGDLVCDPFCGTGMILGAACRMQRRAVGYEIDSNMIDTIKFNLGDPSVALF